MKRILSVLFWAILVIIPQSVNANYLLNMSFDPATTNVSEENTFSVRLNISFDSTQLEGLYPEGYEIYFGHAISFLTLEFDENVVNLLSVDRNNGQYYYSGYEEPGLFWLTPFYVGHGQSFSTYIDFRFQALQNGYTDLIARAGGSDDVGYYRPDLDMFGAFAMIDYEGSTTSGINVPEPATMLLLGLGLIGLAGIRRKIKN